MKLLPLILLALGMFAAAITNATGAHQQTICLVSNAASWGTGYGQPGGAGANCSYGSTLTLTNQTFDCRKPLATYGRLPLRVVVNATGPWASRANAGAVLLGTGCAGDGNSDTVDLIVNIPMKGALLDPFGPGADAIKYNGFPGPHDIQWTGEFQCGKKNPGAHQDGLQMQSGMNMTLVNGKTGFPNGKATCQGAGGAVFYSSANGHFPSCATLACDVRFPVDVVGGIYVACGKGLTGGYAVNRGGGYPVGSTGTVRDAAFRTAASADPNCTNRGGGSPCTGGSTLTKINLNCAGPIPPRPKPLPTPAP
jgi:hypothetical protein